MFTLPCTRPYEDYRDSSISYKIITNSLSNIVCINTVTNIAIFNRFINYIITYSTKELVFVLLICMVEADEHFVSWDSVHSYLSRRLLNL